LIYIVFCVKVTYSLPKVTKKTKSTDKSTKTFKVEITKGLSEDIDKLEDQLDIQHGGFLRMAADFLHNYSSFWQRRFNDFSQFGIYLDKKLGMYRFVENPKNSKEMIFGKTFLIGLMLSEMDDEQKQEYIELLFTEGLSAKQIFDIWTSEEGERI